MPAQDPPSNPQPAASPRPKPRTLRRLGWLATSVVGVLLLLVGATLIVVQTEWGTRWLWQAAMTAAPGQLSGEVAGGTMRGGIRLRNITFRNESQLIFVDRLDAEWRLMRAPLRLHVNAVRAGRIDVTLLPQAQAPSPPTLPQQLTLPLGVTLQSATLQQLDLHRDGESQRFGNIRVQGESDGVRHRLQLLNAETPYGKLQAQARLNGYRPFSIDGTARLEGEIRNELFRADARFSGTLQELAVQLDVMGKKLSGQATIDATPFAAMPFRGAKIAVRHFNPQTFNADWPQADLNLNAALKPAAAVRDLAQLRVEGPVSLTNALPGPLDTGLLPLVSAQANVSLNARAWQVSMLRVTLPGDASFVGSGTIQGLAQPDAQASYKLTGTLRKLNPALLFSTRHVEPVTRTARPALAARINAEFDAQGMLRPELIAKLRFRIFDSMYANLPMTGSGNLRLAGKRMLPGSARLMIAGNTLRIEGGFGSPGQALAVDIDAPALGRLGFGLSGLLRVDAQIAGSWDQAAIEARIRAEDLAFGNRGIGRLSGEVHATGVSRTGQLNPDAPLRITLNASRLRSNGIMLDTLNATIEGTWARHSLRALAHGQMRAQPLELNFAAQGGVRRQASGLAWSGVLGTLENRGLVPISLAAPLTLDVAPGRLELGAGRLTIAQSPVELKGLLIDRNAIRSAGTFNALEVARLLELWRQITDRSMRFTTDLILDGQWDVNIAERASGYLRINRRSGDVRRDGDIALGLNALVLRAEIRGNAIMFNLDADASRLGVINGQGSIGLRPVDGRLGITPGSPLSARINISVPRLQTVGLLAGPRVEISGSITVALVADGTLAEPLLSGTLLAEGLGLTLYDQGVRLHEGTARLRLNDNLLTIEHLNIRGGDGSLRASGSVPLFDARGSMRAVLVADHLQLLLSPSRRMTLSGEATVTNPEGALLLRGKFVVDEARFSLPERAAPRLDDDVVILRGATTRIARQPVILAEKPASPYTPRIDIQVDLGERFYFVGSGADLHLSGTVALRSEPGQIPRAFGTVQVVEGAYESFGTVLQIDRGLINFQGPPTNPSINILATRREAGVTAGVQVSGTVRQPRVQLISDPDLPADERLSWLVFGRSSGAAGTGLAQAAVQEAALGLVNRLSGGRLAQTLGLDALTISQSEYGLNVGQVVNLGKEISDRLYLGYEQSLAGTESVVKLTYELSRYWSVVIRGGSITGLDVFYDRRFDGRLKN